VEKTLNLLQPLSEKPAADETKAVMAALQELRSDLASLSAGETTRSYTDIDDGARKALADKAKALSTAISKLAAAIGLE
jgi:iron uptake system EfeUOB component EfeO/EfeM